jgi:hypothetical protein
MAKFEVGQKIIVCDVGLATRNKPKSAFEAEITKVGRSWVHFSHGGYKDRFDLETMETDYDFGHQSKVFLTKADFEEWSAKCDAWDAIRANLRNSGSTPPEGPSAADLAEALRLITQGDRHEP